MKPQLFLAFVILCFVVIFSINSSSVAAQPPESHVAVFTNIANFATSELTSTVYLPVVSNRWPPIPYTPVASPIDNADRDNGYTVYWAEQPSQLADTYVLQEATDAAFTTGVQTVCTTAQLSCDVSGKTPGTYYYQIRGSNSWGDSPWSNVQSVVIYPLFVGLNLRWDGAGYIRGSSYYNVGTHDTRNLSGLTDADTIRSHGSAWYDPNPFNWPSETWDSYYSVSTGYFKSSSVPDDPAWKWDNPWMLPYDWSFSNGQTFAIDGQNFLVSGPYAGTTSSGKAVQYWQLVNKGKFLYWDGGGDWKQYVHIGDITLWYDAGNTRLLLYSSKLRREYYKGKLTADTVQYIDSLTASNSFPLLGNVTQDTEVSELPVPQPGNRGQTNHLNDRLLWNIGMQADGIHESGK